MCLLASPESRSAVIDFEEIVGVQPYEGMAISNQFSPFFGVSFRLEDANGTDRGWPIIAREGFPTVAFSRDGGASDKPVSTYQGIIGTHFLGAENNNRKLVIDYSGPVSQVSGYILDIDAGEFVTVTAYTNSTSASIVASTNFFAGGPGTGDGIATFWSLSRQARDIRRVEIDGSGAPIGFDLFSSDYSPTNMPSPLLVLQAYPGLRISGTVGMLYRIEYANRITPTNWLTLTNIFLPRSPFLFFDASAAISTQRYYRAVSANP